VVALVKDAGAVAAAVEVVKNTTTGSATTTLATFTAIPASSKAVCIVPDMASASVAVFTSSVTAAGASMT